MSGILALFDQIVFADSIFPYAGLEADTEGNLWALEKMLEPDAASVPTYQVFDAAGRWLGPVQVPEELGEVLEIGNDYLLGVWTDEFNVPYLRMHRVVRGGEG